MRRIKGQVTPAWDRRVDRGTIFGNPFDHQKLGITRAECVKRYRVYFFNRIAKDQNFRNQVLTLKDKVIGCWCVPDLCHATIIAEYLNNLCTSTPTPLVSTLAPENP